MLATDIAVVVPTRGRPGALLELADAWQATGATAPLYFCVDVDDPELDAYSAAYIQIHDRGPFHLHIGERLRLAGTLNYVVKLLQDRYRAVAFMGDDHRPRTPGWDARFAECLSAGAGIVYGNDLLMGERMPTAVCMTSDIPRTLGYICPPGLVHLCLDLVWLDWGQGMGRITYLSDVIIEHMHPANGKAELDAGYTEVNSERQVRTDTEAYVAYRDNGDMATDINKLRMLP